MRLCTSNGTTLASTLASGGVPIALTGSARGVPAGVHASFCARRRRKVLLPGNLGRDHECVWAWARGLVGLRGAGACLRGVFGGCSGAADVSVAWALIPASFWSFMRPRRCGASARAFARGCDSGVGSPACSVASGGACPFACVPVALLSCDLRRTSYE